LVDTLDMRDNMQMNQRRHFSDEFKTEAVRRVREDGRTPASVARELGVPRQMLAAWLKRAKALNEGPESKPLRGDEREELNRLRRENDRLKMERDILKKAAAFFAKESL
jgi:transposase